MTLHSNISTLPLIHFNNNQTTYAFNAILYNSIMWDTQKDTQILVSASTGETVTVTTHSCVIRGGTSTGIDGTTYVDGTYTPDHTNVLTTDPALTSATHKPTVAAYLTGGHKWWTEGQPYIDATGEPFPPVKVSIGAVQHLDIGGHPTRIAA